jgi:hypothetical protein
LFALKLSELMNIYAEPPNGSENGAMRKLLHFEHHKETMAPWSVFTMRLGRNFMAALIVLGGWLVAGTLLYAWSGAGSWTSAFESAAMIASGMGPLADTPAAGIGGAAYAIGSMFIDFFIPSLVLAPIFHRLLHRFHLQDRAKE